MRLTILSRMQDISSRDRFVDEVVNSIAESDHHNEAFIFGISGKWGEGKTYFLDKLQIQLEKCESADMKVVKLNPWKYAHTDDSILRELLRQVLYLQGNRLKRWRLNRRVEGLYHDVSKKKINWTITFAMTVILVIAGLVYKYPPDFLADIRAQVANNKALLTLLLIPVLLGIANAVTTSESSTKAVSTRDKFSDLFDELMEDLSIDKVIVYVDDLDRLTASKAVSVLDSLRTFFDKEQLVFVVASDSTVLERHLGHELIPGAKAPEQMEEGRRFLKKIFNVYWQLPLPTKPEFESYVKTLVGKGVNEFLHEKLRNNVNRKAFRGYLQSYFANNFRNTERFVSRVEFTFRLIEAQYTAKSGSRINKEYFGEMLENPLLVVRILLIEELANPLFGKFQHDPGILLKLEELVTTGDNSGASFDALLGKLSEEQQTFIKSFLGEKPRFRDETGVKVKSIEPYIFLSSDSSFGDIRGLSPKEFSVYLQKNTPAELATILGRSSEQMITEAMRVFSEDYGTMSDPVRKADLLSSLVQVALISDPKLPAQSIIVNRIVGYGLIFLDELPADEKVALTGELGSLNLSKEQFTVLLRNVPVFQSAEWAEIATLDDGKQITLLTQYLFMQFFKDYFLSNPADALTQLGPRLNAFSVEVIGTVLDGSLPGFVSNFLSDHNDERRGYELALIRNIKGGLENLKANVQGELSAKSAPLFNWSVDQARTSSQPLLTTQEIIDAVLLGANTVDTVPDLAERLSLLQTLPEAKDRIWESLFKLDEVVLVDALYEATLIDGYLPLAPSSEAANRVLELVIRRFVNKEVADSPDTTRWLDRVAPERWVFANLRLNQSVLKLINERHGRKYLSDDVRAHLERIKESFKR